MTETQTAGVTNAPKMTATNYTNVPNSTPPETDTNAQGTTAPNVISTSEGAPKPVEAGKPNGTSAAPAQSSTPENKGETSQEKTAAEPQTFSLKLPEGSKLNQDHVKGIEEYAKLHNLTPDIAQKMLERDHALYSGFENSQKTQVEKEIGAWEGVLRADPEYGGSRYSETVDLATRAVERFATPELKQQLEVTGLRKHPELVKMLAKIGKAMADDSFVPSQQATKPADVPLKDLLYANSTSKKK